jgi:2-polyprenyl-3-methyl-5-hydroxy-6-metoxy-1,4-benzoquinol methylase
MKRELLERLRCPKTGQRLTLDTPQPIADFFIESGWLVSVDGQHRYPIRNGIPRFVPEANYADSFGMQWNLFRQTQLDSHSGHPISANRFWKATGWRPEDMKGQWVLDAGCGAGRFAEVALNAGANVVALDYSSAVDACYANLKHHQNLHVVQGDIYALPFERESFSFVYSLGVLQHTPDVAKAFAALPPMLHGGGRLCVDYYEKSWKSLFNPKYWLRPITKRLPKRVLFTVLRTLVPILLPVSRGLGSVPVLGGALKRLVPVANYYGILPLSDRQQKEWSLLDTFDMLSPAYDHPQTATTAREWMLRAGMKDVEILKAGHLVARGHK